MWDSDIDFLVHAQASGLGKPETVEDHPSAWLQSVPELPEKFPPHVIWELPGRITENRIEAFRPDWEVEHGGFQVRGLFEVYSDISEL